MDPNEILTEEEHIGALALHNAAALGASVIRGVAGNDVSTALNGVTMTGLALESLLVREITENLKNRAAQQGLRHA